MITKSNLYNCEIIKMIEKSKTDKNFNETNSVYEEVKHLFKYYGIDKLIKIYIFSGLVNNIYSKIKNNIMNYLIEKPLEDIYSTSLVQISNNEYIMNGLRKVFKRFIKLHNVNENNFKDYGNLSNVFFIFFHKYINDLYIDYLYRIENDKLEFIINDIQMCFVRNAVSIETYINELYNNDWQYVLENSSVYDLSLHLLNKIGKMIHNEKEFIDEQSKHYSTSFKLINKIKSGVSFDINPKKSFDDKPFINIEKLETTFGTLMGWVEKFYNEIDSFIIKYEYLYKKDDIRKDSIDFNRLFHNLILFMHDDKVKYDVYENTEELSKIDKYIKKLQNTNEYKEMIELINKINIDDQTKKDFFIDLENILFNIGRYTIGYNSDYYNFIDLIDTWFKRVLDNTMELYTYECREDIIEYTNRCNSLSTIFVSYMVAKF